MLKYLLMLRYLDVNGALIDFMVKHFSKEDFLSLFEGGAFELQFKYNIFSEDEIDTFYDLEKLKKVEEHVNDLMLKSTEQNIKILSYYDEEYPSNLKVIKKRPLFIYVKGNLELLKSTNSVACVGTRKPSKNALESVNDIVKCLVEGDSVIISGLAEGIDTESHKVCLHNSGKTIAVLAHGLDTIYPKENQKLAESILENDGTLLSEYPIDSKIMKQNFVARNRIVSGLSQGVIIFEANEKSGTMHTARFAYTQGKKIFCPVFTFEGRESLSSGVLNLLNSGSAYAVKNPDEIMTLLGEGSNLTTKINETSHTEKIIDFNVLNKSVRSNFKKHSINIDSELYEELDLFARQNGITIEEVIHSSIREYLGENRGKK